jgi:hypothetical protein
VYAAGSSEFQRTLYVSPLFEAATQSRVLLVPPSPMSSQNETTHGASHTAPSRPTQPRRAAALLREREAASKWELLANPYLLILCHEDECDTCCGYLGHLTQGVREGGLNARPPNLARALDIAWPGTTEAIAPGDSSARLKESLERSYREYDDLESSFKDIKEDYALVSSRLDSALRHGDELAAQLARYERRGRDASGTTADRSSSSMKRKAMDRSPSPPRRPSEASKEHAVAPSRLHKKTKRPPVVNYDAAFNSDEPSTSEAELHKV